MEKLKMHSPNLVAQNIEQLAALFPNCVTESRGKDGELKRAIDFDLLKQELSTHIVDGPQERYQLNWPGKREALLTANAPIAKTLRPCREESVNFDTTQNLFIEGDNLDALKLLQETYLGKVKMIYIDPPYNTGNDFIYNDDFAENADSYIERSNQKDAQGNRLVVNSESSGRFHSNWLSMIYSRIKLSRNLLREDGVLFLSIDDVEVANIRRLCDELYGEQNFIAELVWEGANKNDARQVGISHEYVIVYAKNRNQVPREWSIKKEGVEEVLAEVERLKGIYKNDFDSASRDLAGWFRSMKAKPAFSLRRFRYIDERGVYKEDDPTAPGGRRYELINPKTGGVIPLRRNRGWGFDQPAFNKLVDDGRVSFISSTSVMIRRYLHETDKITPPSVFYQPARSASERLASLIGLGVFNFPKDEFTISKFIEMATSDLKDNCLVIDFFAGSATTAHSVMLQNAADGGNRKFIMVQINEQTNKKTAAYDAGFKTISEISKERIRRAAKDVLSGECHGDWGKDIGFRSLRVDSSNMTDVYYNPDAIIQDDLFAQVDNIKTDRSEEDLLFQVMLDWGVDLMAPILRQTIDGKTVFFVDADAQHQHGALVACFDKTGGIDDAFIRQLAAFSPLRLVFRDAGFASDAVKINAEQLLKQLSPLTEVKAI